MLSKKNITILLIWLLLLCYPPFSFYLIAGFPYLIIKTFALCSLVIIIIIYSNTKISKTFKVISFILLTNIIFYFFSLIYHQDSSYISMAIPVISIFIIYLAVINICGVQNFVKSYILLIIIMGVLGSIAFFLGIIGKSPFFGFIGQPEKQLINYGLTFSNSVFNRGGEFELLRVAGYFDEPGTLAFYITFALLLNQLLFKNRTFERLLIYSGVFTFSLAFFFTLILQFMFYPNWSKYYLRLAIVLIVFFISINFLKEKSSIANVIALMTINRLQASDEGVIKGDNRTTYFAQGIEFFYEKPLLGHGQQNVLTGYKYSGYDPSSFIGYLVFYGIIGTTIIFTIFLYQFTYLFRFDNGLIFDSFVLKVVFIQLLLFIQRPLINVPLAFLLMILIIESMQLRKEGRLNADYGT